MKFLFLTSAILFFLISETLYSDCSPFLERGGEYNKESLDFILNGRQNRDRPLSYYERQFGAFWKENIANLEKKSGHWIEIGGNGVTVKEMLSKWSDEENWLKSVGRNREEISPHVTLISAASKLKAGEYQGGKLKVIIGLIESVDSAKIVKGDLITDLYAAIAYSPYPDIVMKQYLKMLNDDGEILLYMGESVTADGVFGLKNRVITADGKNISLMDWIRSIDGISVSMIEVKVGTIFDPLTGYSLRIKKVKPTDEIVANMKSMEQIAYQQIFIRGKPEGEPIQYFRERGSQIDWDEISSLPSIDENRQNLHYLMSVYARSVEDSTLLTILDSSKGAINWVHLGNDDTFARDLATFSSDKELSIYSDRNWPDGIAAKTEEYLKKLSTRKRVLPQLRLPHSVEALLEIPDMSLDLITDYLGIGMRQLTPDRMVKILLSKIKDSGTIILSDVNSYPYNVFDETAAVQSKELPRYNNLSDESSVIIKKDRTLVTIGEWLKSIPGISVVEKRTPGVTLTRVQRYFIIKILDRSKIEIRGFKLIGHSKKHYNNFFKRAIFSE